MKTYQYLTSGILESYILGTASRKEQAEVDQLLRTDPEIMGYLDEMEVDMEQYFMKNAVPPPPGTKEAILKRIEATELLKWEEPKPTEHTRRTRPAEPAQPQYADVSVSNTHIQVHKYWRPAFIAVFILSKIFLVLGLYYYFKADSQEQEIFRLKAAVKEMTASPRDSTE